MTRSTTTTSTTNFKFAGTDLGSRYQAYVTGTKRGNVGLYIGGADIATLFQASDVPLTVTPTVTLASGSGVSYTGSDTTYFYYVLTNPSTTNAATTFNVSLNQARTVSIFMVGGGGGGPTTGKVCAAGGGGGGYRDTTSAFAANTTYTFTVGCQGNKTTVAGTANGGTTTSSISGLACTGGIGSELAAAGKGGASGTGSNASFAGGSDGNANGNTGFWNGGGGGGCAGAGGAGNTTASGTGGTGVSCTFYTGLVAVVTQANLGTAGHQYGRGGGGWNSNTTETYVPTNYGCGGVGARFNNGTGAYTTTSGTGKPGVVFLRIPK
jgi:hypothetical protein